jgi:hypothetical protein
LWSEGWGDPITHKKTEIQRVQAKICDQKRVIQQLNPSKDKYHKSDEPKLFRGDAFIDCQAGQPSKVMKWLCIIVWPCCEHMILVWNIRSLMLLLDYNKYFNNAVATNDETMTRMIND